FSARLMHLPRMPDPPLFIPLSLDPPRSTPYRHALMPSFAPRTVRQMEGKIRFWAEKIVSEVAPRGECDFMRDVSELFPVSIFMELMGMDLSRLREFRQMSEAYFEAQSRSHQPDMDRTFGAIQAVMTGYILEKQKEPRDDLISRLTQAEISGRPISMEEMQNICSFLFLAGLHTVTNMSAFIFWHLG